jgi:hypothetical protein
MTKTITKLLVLLALVSALSFGQTGLSTTTLSSAITSASATTINLSTTGMLSSGPANQINTGIYIDHEFMWVVTAVDSTHAIVARGKNGTRPFAHVSGATVWFNPPTTAYPAIANSNFLAVSPIEAETIYGACTASAEPTLPKIYVKSGHKLDCLGGVWVVTSGLDYPYYGGTSASIAGAQPLTGTSMSISGTNAITSFTVPYGWAVGQCVSILPTAAFTTTTAGNIAAATTAVANKTLLECWSGTKWVPSY